MADGVMNICKGRIVEFYNRIDQNDPTNSAFILVLLKLSVSDALLIDFDELGALLGDAGNTELTDGSYVRKTLSDTELAALPAPDDSADRYDITLPDTTWTALAGAESVVKLLVCYDSDTAAGTDVNILVCAHHDFVVTTDGSDVTADFGTVWFRAA